MKNLIRTFILATALVGGAHHFFSVSLYQILQIAVASILLLLAIITTAGLLLAVWHTLKKIHTKKTR